MLSKIMSSKGIVQLRRGWVLRLKLFKSVSSYYRLLFIYVFGISFINLIM